MGFIFIMNTINNNISFGHRKIPRYIYHFTNKKNYESILKDGFIKVSDCDPYLQGKGVLQEALKGTNEVKGLHLLK